MCGSTAACPRCDQAVPIPSLSKLKRDAGESVSIESVAHQVNSSVNERLSPFDGRCQMCSQNPASAFLPTRIIFLEERILTGNEVAVSGKGVNIGYAPAEESWHSVFIPCFFCEACSKLFRRKWRKSWVNAMMSKVIRMIWIVPTAFIAIVLIAMLPFVGWTVGAFIFYAIYRKLTRKSADIFLASHIRSLGMAGKLLEEDEYVLEYDHFRGMV